MYDAWYPLSYILNVDTRAVEILSTAQVKDQHSGFQTIESNLIV